MGRMPSAPPLPGELPDPTALPLVLGQSGEAISDLQQRLTKLGHACGGGDFDVETQAAVREFQSRRGLRQDGIVDTQSWSAIVEAGYHLGDRPLYRRRPMLRGDDVAELQHRLSQLGFDSGRIDGILGDDTVSALRDFQRNAGITVDGICGHRTLDELRRLTLRRDAGSLVSPLRERLLLATSGSRTLAGRHVGVGDAGGFASGAASMCRALESAGARALPLQHPDPSRRAAEANAASVDCVVDLRLRANTDECLVAYYRGFRYESLVSKQLAHLLHDELPAALELAPGGTSGMALPILRETRMPAVEIQLGSPALVVRRTSRLASTVVHCLESWISASWDWSSDDPQPHAQVVDQGPPTR